MFPPHLPPPSSNLKSHRQFERLKIILVATFFGLLSGLSGAAILLGWIWPLSGVSDNFFLSRLSSGIPREQLQNRAQIKIADEIFTIYQKSATLGKAHYFSESDKVADAVMGVTSGWLVAKVSSYDGFTKDWAVVAENGSLYSISRGLYDNRAGLLYLSISRPSVVNQQFKVVNFNADVKQNDEVFVYQDGQWHSTLILGPGLGFADSHLDSASMPTYNLADRFRSGSIVIDADGNMVGFVNDRSAVLALQNEDYFLNGIENKKQLVYRSLGVEGWYTDEKMLVINEEKLTGFIVTKVSGNKQFFQKGDIILSVNGRSADRTNLWENLSAAKVRVSIWRAGKIIEYQVDVVEL